MELEKHYKELYGLQDRVMEIVFENSNEFYLTGGTCIARFYKACRYSKCSFLCQEKMFFAIENLIYRLKTFPKNLLNDLNIVNRICLEGFDLISIIEKINNIGE